MQLFFVQDNVFLKLIAAKCAFSFKDRVLLYVIVNESNVNSKRKTSYNFFVHLYRVPL